MYSTEYLDKIDERIKTYLGFGKKATNKTYPATDIFTMPFNKKVLKIILRWILSRIVLRVPGFLRKKIRKYFSIPTNK